MPPEDPSPKSKAPLITATDVAARRAAAEKDESLTKDADLKSRVLRLYDEAQQSLADAARRLADAQGLAKQVAAAAEAAGELDRQLAAEPPPVAPPEHATVAELEKLHRAAEKAAAAATANRQVAEAQLRSRTTTRRSLETKLSTAKTRLASLEMRLAAAPADDQPAQLTLAQQTSLAAERQFRLAEIKHLEAELAWLDASTTHSLLEKQIDLYDKRTKEANRRRDELKTRLDELKAAERATKEEVARRQAESAHPAIAPVARENAELLAELNRVSGLIEEAEIEQQSSRTALAALKARMAATQAKVDAVGMTSAVGLLLRKERLDLPDSAPYRRGVHQRQAAMRSAQVRRLELLDARLTSEEVEARAGRLAEQVEPDALQLPRAQFLAAVRTQLQTKKNTTDLLAQQYEKYFNELLELDAAQRELVAAISQYDAFIGERVLWIRSTHSLFSREGLGDLVTVSGTQGYVRRIQMRATTIQDLNRRELLVPNKQLITGQVVNWTLTDTVYRMDFNVGVAYGSDTDLARELLLKIAKEHKNIVEKPRPKAFFKGFGESTLNFELRAFIDNFDYWPRITHEIHTAIDREFRQAGIVIAFPQRDLHVRSVDPNVKFLRRSEALAEDGNGATPLGESHPQGDPTTT